jgi:phage FluMu protein Com
MILRPRIANITRGTQHSMVASMEEIVAFCPKCKTIETLWLTGGRLTKTQKFSQEDEYIYHDCGSTEPCRLLAGLRKIR